MFFCVYRVMSGARGVGSGALGSSIGALGSVGAFEDPGLFDPRGLSWSPSLDRSMGVLEDWLFRAGCLHSRTEIISLNKLADPLDMEILKL